MILNFYQKSRAKTLLAIVALLCFASYSCKDSKDSVAAGETFVKVNLVGASAVNVAVKVVPLENGTEETCTSCWWDALPPFVFMPLLDAGTVTPTRFTFTKVSPAATLSFFG